MREPNFVQEPLDFSLVLGGPIFQFFRKSRLAGDGLELLYRRLLIIAGIAWLPLMRLTTFGSSAGSVGRLSFFHDVELGARDNARADSWPAQLGKSLAGVRAVVWREVAFGRTKVLLLSHLPRQCVCREARKMPTTHDVGEEES